MTAPSQSRLELEMRAQASVLAVRTGSGWQQAASAAEVWRRDDVDYLVIAARGSSDNAARYAQYLLGVRARLAVALATPWLYSGDEPPLLSRAAVLGISQSGQSPDIVAVLAAARAQGRPTIAITNDVESPLAAADVVMPLFAGEERSVAATKTYLASLHAIAQIAACLGRDGNRGIWFDRLPGLVSATVDAQLTTRDQFDRLDGVQLVTVVGRGLHLSTAYETALKLRELSGIPAEPFSLPDLIHGPIAALRRGDGIWLMSTHGRGQPDRLALELLRRSTGVSVAVTDQSDLMARTDIGVKIEPDLPDWVAPILAVIPGQAAALRLGELHGVDLDRPHGLHKVTLTT
jgi:glucosamine--fructose-6-phosphate aminotransferase (isomerizing)